MVGGVLILQQATRAAAEAEVPALVINTTPVLDLSAVEASRRSRTRRS